MNEDEAYAVICDETNNSAEDIAAGYLNVTVTSIPRFVEINIVTNPSEACQ